MTQPWIVSWRDDPRGRQIADRHYNRRSVGASGFVPPGACLVLRVEGALWVSSWPKAEYVQHAWPDAWINSTFRNERRDLWLSSDLITAAVAATRWQWPNVPDLGMVSFVDPGKVRHKRDPGRCYRKAGFRLVGMTQGGLLAWQMIPADMPDADAPIGGQAPLFAALSAGGGDPAEGGGGE